MIAMFVPHPTSGALNGCPFSLEKKEKKRDIILKGERRKEKGECAL
jgi:hypothetical protein